MTSILDFVKGAGGLRLRLLKMEGVKIWSDFCKWKGAGERRKTDEGEKGPWP